MGDDRVFGRIDAVRVWQRLADARINYAVDEVRGPTWSFDTHRRVLGAEEPGSQEPDGAWEQACVLVRDYQFSPPEIVRALYDPAAPLLGRDMLLEARFHGIHFYFGVRVTELVDETRNDGTRRWGWAYETLDGHLEQGKVTYEVVKHPDTGMVEFMVSSYSRPAPCLDRVTALGWQVFGRRTQLRFYRRCGERLQAFVEAGRRGDSAQLAPPRVGRLVIAPADAKIHRVDRLAIHRIAPG